MTEISESGCKTCVAGGGACCRAFTFIHLTPTERDRLEEKGAVLRELDAEGLANVSFGRAAMELFLAQTPPGKGAYRFLRHCPNLDENRAEGWAKCRVYNAASPERPEACGQFRVGSLACHEAQQSWAEWQALVERDPE